MKTTHKRKGSSGRDNADCLNGNQTQYVQVGVSDELRVNSFPDRFTHYAWTAAQSAHSDFVGLRLYACLGVTCHQHFWLSDRGVLRATAVMRGWHGHRIRVSTQSRL